MDADDYGGARQAVEHLLALGHRKIGYIGVGNRVQSNRRRLAGYRDTLWRQPGIAVDAQWVRIAPPLAQYAPTMCRGAGHAAGSCCAPASRRFSATTT